MLAWSRDGGGAPPPPARTLLYPLLKNGFVFDVDRVRDGVNGTKNGFLSDKEPDLDGEIGKIGSEVEYSNGGWVGDRSGEGGSVERGKLGGRVGLGVRPLKRRCAGDRGVENGPGVGGLTGYDAGQVMWYMASAAL